MAIDTSPLVSCIMPTSDRRSFLPRAIAFFQRQNYPNKELLVVDDGIEPIADLIPSDERIRLIRLPNRTPVGHKRNVACEQASGPIIAHFDDDDWHAPHRLQYQVDRLVNSAASICGIKDLLYLDIRNGTAWQYNYPAGQRPWLSGSSLMYTRAFWTTHRFAAINVGEDSRFVWSAPVEQLLDLPDRTFHVGIIHGNNVSPKHVTGAWWSPYPVEDLQGLLGQEWDLYQSMQSMPAALQTRGETPMPANDNQISAPSIAVVVTCHQPYMDLLPQITGSIDRQMPAATEKVVALDRCSRPSGKYDGWKFIEGDWGHPSGGRNAGMLATTSPWLTFWDADNIMPDGYLAAGRRAVAGVKSDIAILYPDVQLCDERLNHTGFWKMPDWNYWSLRGENCVDTASLWRREAVEIAGGWPVRSGGSFEDYALALDITAGGWKAARLDAPAILMRTRLEGRMQQRWADGGALTDLWNARSMALVTLLAGRDETLDRWIQFLESAQLPARTALYVVDNSGRDEFSLKAWNACRGISVSRSFTHFDFASAGGPYRPKDREPYFVKGRHLHVARLYAGILPRVTEDLVLTLEDDVVPPMDAPLILGREIGFPSRSKIGAVAAAYPMPQNPNSACAGRGTDSWGASIPWNQLPAEMIDVGYVGGGCTVWANWALKKIPVNFWWDRGMGWDAALCSQLRGIGYQIKLHGDVRCTHHLHGDRIHTPPSAVSAKTNRTRTLLRSAGEQPHCQKHPQTWIEPAQLGDHFPPYLSTYPNNPDFNLHRQFLLDLGATAEGLIATDITGWLRPQDAMKLFELAYFSRGDILEIGCHQGLSTWIIAQAVGKSGLRKQIISLDKSPAHVARAGRNLACKGVRQLVNLVTADATQYCRQQAVARREFSFIFVDHSHEYRDVVEVCQTLSQILAPGGFCLFHDFNDSRNNLKEHPDYGVSQAVREVLKSPEFEFYGIYGCTALYRKVK